MNAETRAKDIVDALDRLTFGADAITHHREVVGELVEAARDKFHELMPGNVENASSQARAFLITQAIRQAENAAYDRAADLVYDESCDRAIRSLKSP